MHAFHCYCPQFYGKQKQILLFISFITSLCTGIQCCMSGEKHERCGEREKLYYYLVWKFQLGVSGKSKIVLRFLCLHHEARQHAREWENVEHKREEQQTFNSFSFSMSYKWILENSFVCDVNILFCLSVQPKWSSKQILWSTSGLEFQNVFAKTKNHYKLVLCVLRLEYVLLTSQMIYQSAIMSAHWSIEQIVPQLNITGNLDRICPLFSCEFI